MQLNLLDYIIAIFLASGLISGFRQGFVRALGGIVGALAGIILALAYYDNLALYMEDYYGVITLIADFIREKLFLTSIPAMYIFDSLPFWHGGKEADVAYYLASFLVLFLSFVILFVILSRLAGFLWNQLDIVFIAGFLAGINRLAGMLLALAKNFVILAVFLSFLTPFINAGADIGISSLFILRQGIENSYFANIIFKVLNEIKTWWFLKG